MKLTMEVKDETGKIVENGNEIAALLQALLAALGQGTAPLLLFDLQLQAGAAETVQGHLYFRGILSNTIIYNVARTRKDKKKAEKILLQLLNSTGIDLNSAEWVGIELHTTQSDGPGRARLVLKKVNGTWQLPDGWLGETAQPGWFSRMLTGAWEWINRRKAG